MAAIWPGGGPEVKTILIDSGFYSDAAVQAVEQNPDGTPTGVTVFAAVEKSDHHKNRRGPAFTTRAARARSGSDTKGSDGTAAEDNPGKMLLQTAQATVEAVLAVTMQNVGACLQAIPRVESPASRLLHRLPDGVMFTSDGGILEWIRLRANDCPREPSPSARNYRQRRMLSRLE